MLSIRAVVVTAIVAAISSTLALAQSPIQWQGNARSAIAQAAEQSMPLMFWVTGHEEGLNRDEIKDAQEEAFRDPAVVAIAQRRFIPVRVARNSRMLEEAQQLGLPTSHGLYIAIISPDGKLIQQINPSDVANPEALANLLMTGLHKYLEGLYTTRLKPVITSPESSKQDLVLAVQTVWRLGIVIADKDCVALLDRKDLTNSERSRLESMLAAMATAPCIDALLTRGVAGDKDAVSALERAEPGALNTLLQELPATDESKPTPRQLLAYRVTCRIVRDQYPRPESFWDKAKPEQRAEVINALKLRAGPILEYWIENVGRWL